MSVAPYKSTSTGLAQIHLERISRHSFERIATVQHVLFFLHIKGKIHIPLVSFLQIEFKSEMQAYESFLMYF